ncbi:dicarboxylate/amino acid:cation symporter [Fusobacterium canifelinum]|uniref:Dicarboxylate/amino acid:cation symporter n=1 Tax=Fusobacterium canifelinum TaxID=285729 RepID=A0A7T4KFN8_9FUSO|nr:dicarboxylate/amino acid:cation symporter [Fusobacterium canifelinum]QQB73061.1 dicarboxylate/amino acid:cation symporter [Fusobacterium canifelinum]
MEKEKKGDTLIIKLILGVIAGIIIGLLATEKVISVILPIKFFLGELIFFVVPFIIIGFIAPSITQLKSNASKMLLTMLGLSYLSSIGAAFFSATAGYILIPKLNIVSSIEGLKELPKILFKVQIPPVISVMGALVLSLLLGLAVVWTNSKRTEELLNEFNNIILMIVNKIIIPILPIFIATTFATLAYEGSITKQFPVFIKVILIVLVGHYIWIAILYTIAGIVSGKNPWKLLKHYGPAYMTAVGTMSSAATLPVSLNCVRRSGVLDEEITNFAIPLGATTHLCGSVLTETFFVMVVSKILYGSVPSVGSMILFILLFGIFAVGAPGVPGGTVLASLGLIISVLGFDETGTALVITIFALQDSFGTACNITSDGALALILSGIFRKKQTN